MANLRKITIDKFRSIDHVELFFPEKTPVVIVGENNAGKSNIVAAIDIVLGEHYPKTRILEERDFYFRNPEQSISIMADFYEPLAGKFQQLHWKYDPTDDRDPLKFVGIDVYGEQKWPRNEDRDDCMCIFVQAERSLNYQLSYQTKYTMLSKLMHAFHKELQRNQQVRDDLQEEFEKVKGLFDQVDAFKTFKDTLQTDFSSLVSCMTYKLEVDLEAYNPTNFFHALRVQAKEKGEVRDFDELGTGEQQVLAISFAHAYARALHKTVLLAIEEPEAHLHPQAQRWLAKRMFDFAQDGLQIVITTHSPAFINLAQLDGLVLTTKTDRVGTTTRQLTREELTEYCVSHNANRQKTQAQNIFEFYAANTTEAVLEGFFSKLIVLVEGPTEAMALPVYLRGLRWDPVRQGISFIPVGGKGNIPRFWRLFTAFRIPVFVIFDNDSQDDQQSLKRQDICETLGLHDPNEIQGVLDEQRITVKNGFAVFGGDFEKALRRNFINVEYEKHERETREFLGIDPGNLKECKPLVARRVAEKLIEEVDERNEMWSPLIQLRNALQAMLKQAQAIHELSVETIEEEGSPF